MESYTSLGEILVSLDAVMEFVYSSLPYPAVKMTFSSLLLLDDVGSEVGSEVGSDVGSSAFAMEGCGISIGIDDADSVAICDMNVRRSFSLSLFGVWIDDSNVDVDVDDDEAVVKADALIVIDGDGAVHA